jgi:hypothetical protein
MLLIRALLLALLLAALATLARFAVAGPQRVGLDKRGTHSR